MMEKIESCALCAWRETCQKKFSISGRSIHCPDFVRDISIKPSREATEDEGFKEIDDAGE